jgi:endonuclease YncB( thermonuclease family)
VTTLLYGPYPALLQRWHDGDTCHLDVDLGFGLVLALSCRCYGINAPELHDAAGPPALAYARSIVPEGSRILVTSHGWDKYGGRFLGEITGPGGALFGPAMIKAGHAKAYFGTGPKA